MTRETRNMTYETKTVEYDTFELEDAVSLTVEPNHIAAVGLVIVGVVALCLYIFIKGFVITPPSKYDSLGEQDQTRFDTIKVRMQAEKRRTSGLLRAPLNATLVLLSLQAMTVHSMEAEPQMHQRPLPLLLSLHP